MLFKSRQGPLRQISFIHPRFQDGNIASAMSAISKSFARSPAQIRKEHLAKAGEVATDKARNVVNMARIMSRMPD